MNMELQLTENVSPIESLAEAVELFKSDSICRQLGKLADRLQPTAILNYINKDQF